MTRDGDIEIEGVLWHRRVPLVVGCVALLMFSVAVGSVAQAASPTPSVQEELDRWVDSPRLKGLRVGLSFRHVSSGALVASHEGAALLNPASGAKLLTTAVALMTFGAQAQVRTTVHGQVEEGGAAASLVLRGEGDPKLLLPQITALAQALHARGIKRVGRIDLDASVFDEERLPPAFEQKDTDAGYRAAIGAAASMFGALEVTVHPASSAGKRPRVTLNPPTSSHVRVVNEARTVDGKGPALEVRATDDGHGRVLLRVTGTMGVAAEPWWGRRRVMDPDGLTVDLLREALEALDVEVTSQSPPRRVNGEPGPALAVVQSAPLIESLGDVNRWSNNFMAEMVFKRLGAGRGPASFQRAQSVVSQALVDLSIPPEEFKVVNGSGLYQGTQASANALTRLLVAMDGEGALGAEFRGTLARPRAVGTLSGRLKGLSDRVWAKTGTLDEVVSLSGYLKTRSEGTWAFSVIINDATPSRTVTLRKAIDRLVGRLSKR